MSEIKTNIALTFEGNILHQSIKHGSEVTLDLQGKSTVAIKEDGTSIRLRGRGTRLVKRLISELGSHKARIYHLAFSDGSFSETLISFG